MSVWNPFICFAELLVIFDPQNGNVIVSDVGFDTIYVFSPDEKLISSIGKPGREDGSLTNPCGIALGLEGELVVCDTNLNRMSYSRPQLTL